MEKHSMLMVRKNQYQDNGHIAQSKLQIQCYLHKATIDLLYRTGKKHLCPLFDFFLFVCLNLLKFSVESGYQPFVKMDRSQNFFPFSWLLVHSTDSFFCCAEALKFNQIPFAYFGFCCHQFWCFSHEVLAHTYVLNGFAQVFFQGFLWCQV